MSTDDIEYYTANLIPKKEVKDLIYWKNLNKKQLEDYELEAMMIRKYFKCSFYQKCRMMNADELSARFWEIEENRMPYIKIQIEDAERKIYLNHQARENLRSEMMPFSGVNLKEEKLIQKELFI